MGSCNSKISNIHHKSENDKSLKLKTDVTIYLHNLKAKWKYKRDECYDSDVYFSDGNIYIENKTALYDGIVIHTDDYDTDYTDEWITIYNLHDLSKINDICMFAIDSCNKYLINKVSLRINFYCLHMIANNDAIISKIKQHAIKLENYKPYTDIRIQTKYGKQIKGTLRDNPWLHDEKHYDINIFRASTLDNLIKTHDYIVNKILLN